MPWTLWRYTTVELLRFVVLSTAVLVGVIAFAAAVKPLADGELGPLSALRFMLLAMPPMLGYALPFAAAFGTSMTYYRMAQDNEVLAARAGGMSHRRALMPAVAVGVSLAAVLGILNDQVIPRFLREMEDMVTRDLAKLLVRSIERGDAVTLGSLSVYADDVRDLGPDPEAGFLERLYLTGVAAIDVAPDGGVAIDATTESAYIVLTEGAAAGFDAGELACVIVLENGVGFSDGSLTGIERLQLDPFRVPDAFEDDPKFLTGGELAALPDSPEQMSFVESRRARLARELAEHDALLMLRSTLQSGARVEFVTATGDVLLLRAGGLVSTGGSYTLLPPGGGDFIEIERIGPAASGSRLIERIEAASGTIEVDATPTTADLLSTMPGSRSSLAFSVSLTGAFIRSGSDFGRDDRTRGAERSELTVDGLTLRDDPMQLYRDAPPAALLEAAAAVAASTETQAGARDGTARLSGAAADLDKRVARLEREVISKRHERLAFAASCAVMVFTGAVMAIKLSNSLPLVVYLWSFLPALGNTLLISAGQQHAHRESVPVGLLLLWSGVVLLAAYAVIVLNSLSKR
ncbi:MAG: LptF/LptG family permease [Planctomycetota bacterium]